jgi:hypothetical protein
MCESSRSLVRSQRACLVSVCGLSWEKLDDTGPVWPGLIMIDHSLFILQTDGRNK